MHYLVWFSINQAGQVSLVKSQSIPQTPTSLFSILWQSGMVVMAKTADLAYRLTGRRGPWKHYSTPWTVWYRSRCMILLVCYYIVVLQNSSWSGCRNDYSVLPLPVLKSIAQRLINTEYTRVFWWWNEAVVDGCWGSAYLWHRLSCTLFPSRTSSRQLCSCHGCRSDTSVSPCWRTTSESDRHNWFQWQQQALTGYKYHLQIKPWKCQQAA